MVRGDLCPTTGSLDHRYLGSQGADEGGRGDNGVEHNGRIESGEVLGAEICDIRKQVGVFRLLLTDVLSFS